MSWYWNLSSVLLGFAIILGVGWLIGVLEKRDRHRRFREKENGTQNRERTDEDVGLKITPAAIAGRAIKDRLWMHPPREDPRRRGRKAVGR